MSDKAGTSQRADLRRHCPESADAAWTVTPVRAFSVTSNGVGQSGTVLSSNSSLSRLTDGCLLLTPALPSGCSWRCDLTAGVVIYSWRCDLTAGVVIYSWRCDLTAGVVIYSWRCDLTAGVVIYSWRCDLTAGVVIYSWRCDLQLAL